MQIKQFLAVAFHSIFEEAAKIGRSCETVTLLNNSYAKIMAALLNCFFSEETLASGTLLSLSNSVNTCLENCDQEHLKSELFQICEFIYNKIVAFNSQPPANLNMEQREHFLNNWCSAL